MRKILSGKDGFTLVELLVVTAILGIVVVAIYSMYLTHMRNAYTQDEVVEVQQNLRIAMDAISRDIKMAGALVPYGTSPISSTAPNLVINTGVPTEAVVRIETSEGKSITVGADCSLFTTTVNSPDELDYLAVGDTVRVIRPLTGDQPFDTATIGNIEVESITKATSTISLKRVDGGNFPEGVIIKSGDIIAKSSAAATVKYTAITYSVGSCPVGSGMSDNCLYRSGDVIATNISAVNFALITEDNNGSPNATQTAVQVTIDGVTVKKASSTDTQRTRELTSTVKLRNRRYF